MREINLPILAFVLILFLYVLIVIVLLELVYFERTLVEVVELLNRLGGLK